MGEHLLKNWPVYVLMTGFIWFVASAAIHARKEEKKGQGQKNGKEQHK